ncbi:hypothetical protein [Microvirus sp.]|nr:hypothetical protein [Microvirus sp.]
MKNSEIFCLFKNNSFLCLCRNQTHYFINILNFTIMQKFIISLKEKQTGRDVMPPYIVNSLDGLGNYSERVSPLGLIVIVDSIKEENNFVELKTQSDEK